MFSDICVFDRSFLESRFPVFADHNFACSLDEIPWAEWGIPSAKLDYLGFKFGMFHIGHRARADVDMLLSLLVQETPDKSKNVLSVFI